MDRNTLDCNKLANDRCKYHSWLHFWSSFWWKTHLVWAKMDSLHCMFCWHVRGHLHSFQRLWDAAPWKTNLRICSWPLKCSIPEIHRRTSSNRLLWHLHSNFHICTKSWAISGTFYRSNTPRWSRFRSPWKKWVLANHFWPSNHHIRTDLIWTSVSIALRQPKVSHCKRIKSSSSWEYSPHL